MTVRRFLSSLWLGLAYFAAAAFAVALTRFEGGVAFIWLATSFLAANLMARPRHSWIAAIIPCAVASILVTGWWGLGWAMAGPFAAINMVEAVAAAWLFRRFADPRRPLGSLGWLMQFVASVGIVAPLIAALLAALAVSWTGLSPARTIVTFFAGHALGNLTFTPIALLLTRGNRQALVRDMRRRDTVEIIALLMLVMGTCAWVFGQQDLPLLFLPAFPIILVAFRVGRVGVALSIALLALIGGIVSASGSGPIRLVDATFGQQMQFFQFYLAATVLTLLPVAADLENRARLHRKMRESEAGYRMIAEYSSDLIFSLKVDGTIRYVSPSCRQMGYAPEQLIGRNCASLIAPGHLGAASEAHLRSLGMGGETNRFEYLAVMASGEHRWAETHARLIVDDDGHPDGILSIVRDIHDQKLVELKLSEAALVDSLTGLGNRLAYRNTVERRDPQAGDIGACVAMLDIDHFKMVNDRYGHDAGDVVLQGFADVARRIVREGDMVARLGGEEFAIFFPDTALAQALAICDRLRSELGATIFRAGTNAIAVTVSGGVAQLGEDGIDAGAQNCRHGAVPRQAGRAEPAGTGRLSPFMDAGAQPGVRMIASCEVEADAQSLGLGGAGQDLVTQEAFPQQQQSGLRVDGDEWAQRFGGVLAAGRRGHHHRQARILEANRARAGRGLDIERSGQDAVRVDVRAVMPAGLQEVDPQAVELWLTVPRQIFGESGGVAGEQSPQIGERRIAARQIVKRGVAGIAPVAMVAAPPDPGAIVGGEAADRMRQFVEQISLVEHGFVKRCGEQAAHCLSFPPSPAIGQGRADFSGGRPFARGRAGCARCAGGVRGSNG